MISKELLAEFAKWAKHAERSQQEFAALYAKACVEAAGNKWVDDPVPVMEAMQAEIRPVVVKSDTNPLGIHNSVFCAWCHAARVALLFDVPFSIANRCKPSVLPAIKEIINADNSDDSSAVKFSRALEAYRTNQRKAIRDRKEGDERTPPVSTSSAESVDMVDEGSGEAATPDQIAYRLCKQITDVGQRCETIVQDERLKCIVELARQVVQEHEAGEKNDAIVAAQKLLAGNGRNRLAESHLRSLPV